jgi:hypothetical protein
MPDGGSWIGIAFAAAILTLALALILRFNEPWFWLAPLIVLFIVLSFGCYCSSRPGPPQL